MSWELHVETGKHAGRRIPLVERFLIGRDDVCDLRPASIEVSRRHCILSLQFERLYVLDCCATNGTFVNAQRLFPGAPVELHPGDRLEVGPLAFVIDQIVPSERDLIDLSAAELLLEMDRQEDSGVGAGVLLDQGRTLHGNAQAGELGAQRGPADAQRSRRLAQVGG